MRIACIANSGTPDAIIVSDDASGTGWTGAYVGVDERVALYTELAEAEMPTAPASELAKVGGWFDSPASEHPAVTQSNVTKLSVEGCPRSIVPPATTQIDMSMPTLLSTVAVLMLTECGTMTENRTALAFSGGSSAVRSG